MRIRLALGLFALTLATRVTAAGSSQHVAFARTVTNLEYAAIALNVPRPESVKKAPQSTGELWYGSITRRLPQDGPRDVKHVVPFLASYDRGVAVAAWADTNFDGDLTNDPQVRLAIYPPTPEARSFLTDLRWAASTSDGVIPVDWKVRVVLEPAHGESAPIARIQMVYALTGTVTLEGKPHVAVLFDGNGDGLYTKGFFDGMFIDVDDKRAISVDLMSPGFGPFAVPFQIGSVIYEVGNLDPRGGGLDLTAMPATLPARRPVIGESAPSFDTISLDGSPLRLDDFRGKIAVVYFYASWCGNSEWQVPLMEDIYRDYRPGGLTIIGISYDTDRMALEAFRARHHLTWPTTFSGHMFWEDRVGRLYQAQSPGLSYLIDPQGRIEGVYREPGALRARIQELIPKSGHRRVRH